MISHDGRHICLISLELIIEYFTETLLWAEDQSEEASGSIQFSVPLCILEFHDVITFST